jgi:hypothetical protein
MPRNPDRKGEFMPTPGNATRFGPRGHTEDDVESLLRQIKEIALHCQQLKRRDAQDPERAEAERSLEQLRWRLAAAVRRSSDEDSGAAA